MLSGNTNAKINCDDKLTTIAVRNSLKNRFKKTLSGNRASMGQITEILIENFITEVENKGFFMPRKCND